MIIQYNNAIVNNNMILPVIIERVEYAKDAEYN